MMMKKNSQHLSAFVMAVILLSLMYSFGTFGFLNLFGARLITQSIVLGIITLLFIFLNVSVKIKYLFLILSFCGTYVVGTFIFGGPIGGLADIYIFIFCLILFFYSPPNHIVFFSKALVVVTSFLCCLVLI